ncbi:nuclear transport factor 2 family protein [Hyphomicrobium sp.]|uniref:nuclear transport factor 2 family protein n=1 Tax=Hyphomicrobium sp. TaxID=82 RepID=UPI003F6F1484
MKKFDAQSAHDIMISVHDAWSTGAVERMLSHYTDDLTYWCNAGEIRGVPFQIDGKQGLRTFLRSILAVAESATAVEDFKLEDGLGHVTINAYIRHRRTGHEIRGSYRQVVMFRGRKICRVDEFHDGERMSQFWRMVSVDGETPPCQDPRQDQ